MHCHCTDCTALRATAGPLDLVIHCGRPGHPPYVDRPHSGADCPECQWESPLGQAVLGALRGEKR